MTKPATAMMRIMQREMMYERIIFAESLVDLILKIDNEDNALES